MGEEDRNYYNDFAVDAKREYEQQVVEYRATGTYTPSKEFDKLEGVNVWVRRHFQNGLERELCKYTTCHFPKRPPEMDEAYERREERSKLRRKLKLKGLLNEDKTLKNGLDFEELLEQDRQLRAKKDGGITSTNDAGQSNPPSETGLDFEELLEQDRQLRAKKDAGITSTNDDAGQSNPPSETDTAKEDQDSVCEPTETNDDATTNDPTETVQEVIPI
jgi:hypothetical protein